ncbi:MAG: ATP-binding cassette domain-containing protein [Thermodesulfobacteriota bacterium]
MQRLVLDALGKSFGPRSLFSNLSLELRSGQRLAVLGRNGTGKSTLLRILAGQEEPDQGGARLDPHTAALGFSVQELQVEELQTGLLQWVLQGIPSWAELWAKWEQAGQESPGAWKELAEQQSALELFYGFNPEHKAKKVLAGLGFEPEQFSWHLKQLSGGWRERAKLARILVQGSQVLLLDEPTNHLDLEAVRWLEEFLLSFSGIVVFVAHDRYFLQKVGNCILHLAPEGPIFKELDLEGYLAWRAQRDEARQRRQEKLQQEIEHKQKFVDRFRYKASKAALAQSRIKQIQGLQEQKQALDAPQESAELSFSWPEPARSNKLVLQARGLQFEYAPGQPLWPAVDLALYKGQKVALLGPNGAGKSTLLKLVAEELEPTRGALELGSLVTTAFFHQHVAHILHEKNTVLEEIDRLSAPGLKQQELCFALGLFQLGEDYWQLKVASLSGGEKNRLILASVFLRRANFLLLDEPSNHLDLESRQALVQALQKYSGTLLLISHDRYLLSQVAESVWVLSSHGLEQYDFGFQDYLARQEKESCSEKRAKDNSERGKEEYKRQKRLQAEKRNQLYRALQPCKQRYAALEGQLEDCLQQQKEVEDSLASQETYQDAGRVQELNKEYVRLQQLSEEILQEMEDLESRMQELQAQAS